MTPEQEAASIMRYVLGAAGNPRPYYHNIPETFAVPSVFFPMPEAATGPDTFLSYSVDYQWYIKFFASTTGEAYEAGMKVLSAIQSGRRLIPLLSESGEWTGERLRLNDPAVKAIDDEATGFGTAQLYVSWRSRRPYDRNAGDLMRRFHIFLHDKEGQAGETPAASESAEMDGYYLQEG